MSKDRVLIVGGGVIGVCTAYYLQQQGAEVTIIDKGDLGGGCSYGNGGLLVPSHSLPLCSPGMVSKGLLSLFSRYKPFSMKLNLDWTYLQWLWLFNKSCSKEHFSGSFPVLKDLAENSLELYREISQKENINFFLQEKGLLTLYKNNNSFKKAKQNVDFFLDQGFSLQVLEGNEVQAYEHNVLPVSGGIYSDCDAHVSPSLFIRKLSDVIVSNGGSVFPDTQVLSFVRDGKKLREAITTQGNFQFDQVVIAAGVYTSSILKRLDVCIPLQPAKGYSLSYEQKRTVVTRPLMLDDARVVVTPLDKELRFSGLLDLGGFDEKLHRSRIKRIHRAINDFISIGSDILLAEKRWCGLRPCTPDGLPIISRAEAIPNLVIATGHAMLGMTLGPMSGKLAAEILACKPTTMNVSSLCLDRF